MEGDVVLLLLLLQERLQHKRVRASQPPNLFTMRGERELNVHSFNDHHSVKGTCGMPDPNRKPNPTRKSDDKSDVEDEAIEEQSRDSQKKEGEQEKDKGESTNR